MDKEKKRAYDKAYYEANREKILARDKAYYEANREKVLARKKAYYEANREKTLALKKAYYKANGEKIRANNKKRSKVYSRTDIGRFRALRGSAKRRGIPVALTFDQYVGLYQRECFYHRGPCTWSETGCGIDRRRSDEGYTLENSVRCCAPCNFEKGQMESSAYLAVWRWRHRHGVMDWHDPRLAGVLPGRVKKNLEQGEDE